MSVNLYEGCWIVTRCGGVFGPMLGPSYQGCYGEEACFFRWSASGRQNQGDKTLDALSVHFTEAEARRAAIALHRERAGEADIVMATDPAFVRAKEAPGVTAAPFEADEWTQFRRQAALAIYTAQWAGANISVSRAAEHAAALADALREREARDE